MLKKTKKQALNDSWHSGYCETTVRHSATLPVDDENSRVAWLKQHIEEDKCEDCMRATVMKNSELRTAELIGCDAVKLFWSGGDITTLDGYKVALGQVMIEYKLYGFIDNKMIAWMEKIATERHDKNWPGLADLENEEV